AAIGFVLLALFLRPALMAFAIAAALLAVGRAELPPVDPMTHLRAASLAGTTIVITGRVADDSRRTGGGAEVLVEPSRMQSATATIGGIGNLMVRWRGPAQASYGDSVQ